MARTAPWGTRGGACGNEPRTRWALAPAECQEEHDAIPALRHDDVAVNLQIGLGGAQEAQAVVGGGRECGHRRSRFQPGLSSRIGTLPAADAPAHSAGARSSAYPRPGRTGRGNLLPPGML